VTGHRSPEQALAAAVGVDQSMRLYPAKEARERRRAAADQLALELHPDAPETETALGDLDMARADRRRDAAERRLLAAIAAAAKARPCRCHPGPMVLDEDDLDEVRCSRCGREVSL
jgi:hypothetical protein